MRSLAAMIHILGEAGQLMALETDGPLSVRAVNTAIRRSIGMPRGEQELHLDGERLAPMQTLSLAGDGRLVLTLARTQIVCGGCGADEGARKYRLCSGCLDTRYCCVICQKRHWKHHRRECRRGR